MRKTPYTKIGIRRLKCFRCSNRAEAQWQICSDGNVWRPLCLECDVKMNKMVLGFMGFKDSEEKIAKYREEKFKKK